MLDEKNRPALSRMEKRELRFAWPNEASDFTPWLADNLSLLGETIGIELELEAQEKYVGPFRADILAKDVIADKWVLIENQLETTNHKHLGQLIAYAAGLKAATIIWLADRFTDEHRAAMDWLNEITSEDINFFGLEIELWQVGDQIAPRFNIICKPNTWSKKASQTKKILTASPSKMSKQREAILWALKDSYPQTMSPAEVARKTGVSTPDTTRKIMKNMKDSGLIISPFTGEYTLPENTEQNDVGC